MHGSRDAGECGGLFGDGQHARMLAMRHGVELAQELERLEILAAAVLVRQPLARLAAVVEVQHRRDGIDAQAVDVVALHPVQRVRDQEVLHLVAAVVEDLGAPVAVLAEARVGVFVERGAVELGETVRVLRKMRRAPSRGSRRCRPGGTCRRRP